jgi:hypothetical protein
MCWILDRAVLVRVGNEVVSHKLGSGGRPASGCCGEGGLSFEGGGEGGLVFVGK